MPLEGQQHQNYQELVDYIHNIYKDEKLVLFVKMVSSVMKIVYKTNIESYENMSLLLFCVFGKYFPDMILSVKDEEE